MQIWRVIHLRMGDMRLQGAQGAGDNTPVRFHARSGLEGGYTTGRDPQFKTHS